MSSSENLWAEKQPQRLHSFAQGPQSQCRTLAEPRCCGCTTATTMHQAVPAGRYLLPLPSGITASTAPEPAITPKCFFRPVVPGSQSGACISDCQRLSQGPLPTHRQAGKHMHVVLSASLVGSRLSLRMRGIPHYRRRVLILGSQREEQSNMIVDAKGV